MTLTFPMRVRARLGSTVSFRVASLWIIIPTIVVACIAVPFKATVDGILYLSSAKSLFNSAFSTDYVWFREPGYPLFLRAIHFLGNDGMFIILVQALCLGLASAIALYSVRRALGHTDVSVGQLAVVVILTLNPMYLIYSALVLQQALFALQLALFALGVVWAINRPAGLRGSILVPLVLLNYVAAIWTSIGWIYLALVPVILTIVIVCFPWARRSYAFVKSRERRIVVVVATVVAIGAVSVLTYEGGLAAYSGWQAIKTPHLRHLTIPGAVIEPLSTVPQIPTPVGMVARMLAIMHMGTVGPYVHENDLFLRQQMIPSRSWGLEDTGYIRAPYTTYSSGWIAIPDASEQVHFVYAQLAPASPLLYSGVFIGYLLSIALSLIRRKWGLVVVLAIPLSFIAVYAASNSPIDRYGVPAYPFAVAGVGVIIVWLVELIRGIRGARHSERLSPRSA
jgi:hypothetical protein